MMDDKALFPLDRLLSMQRHTHKLMGAFAAKACRDYRNKHILMLLPIRKIMDQYGQEKRLYVSDICRELKQSPQSISRLLRLLEKDGLLERYADPRDRRKTFIMFTEEGEGALSHCIANMTVTGNVIIQKMGEERFQRLCEDYEIFMEIMKKETSDIREEDFLMPPFPPKSPETSASCGSHKHHRNFRR